MKRCVFCFIICLFSLFSSAQIHPVSARDLAMGNATAASPSGGISENKSMSDKAGWMIEGSIINRYLIKQLSPVFITVERNASQAGYFACVGRMGGNEFSEQLFSAGVRKILLPNFSAAISLEYHRWQLPSDYTSQGILLPAVYLYARCLPQLSFGAIIRNPVRSRMNAIEEKKLPAKFHAAFCWSFSQQTTAAFGATQITGEETRINTGIEYRVKAVAFRAGCITNPVTVTMGAGFQWNQIKLDFGYQGYSPPGPVSAASLTFIL